MEQSRSFWNCAQDQRGRTYLNLSRPEATPQLRTGNATPLYCWMLIADYYFFFTMIFLCVESCVLVDERRRWFGISVSYLLRFFSYIVVVFCLLLFFRFFTFLGSNIALCHYRLYRVAPTSGKIGIWCFLLLFYPYFQVECFRFKSVFVDFMRFVLIMKHCRVTLDI